MPSTPWATRTAPPGHSGSADSEFRRAAREACRRRKRRSRKTSCRLRTEPPPAAGQPVIRKSEPPMTRWPSTVLQAMATVNLPRGGGGVDHRNAEALQHPDQVEHGSVNCHRGSCSPAYPSRHRDHGASAPTRLPSTNSGEKFGAAPVVHHRGDAHLELRAGVQPHRHHDWTAEIDHRRHVLAGRSRSRW